MKTGRPNKPESQKTHRNPPTYEWVTLPPARKGRVPTLPKDLDLLDFTHRWWRDIWHTPMATMWTAEDIHPLIELAVLRDKLLRGQHSVANEVRQRSDAYGLTFLGRRALRWRLPADPEPDERPKAKPGEDELKKRRTSRTKGLKAKVKSS